MPQDIFIIPRSGDPQILFRGSVTNDTPIYLNVLSSYQSATGSGTALAFEGTQGQLFSVTDNLSSGVLFSVSDITGLPAIEYNASGRLNLGEYANNINLYSTSGVNVVSKTSTITPFSITLASGQNTDAMRVNSFGNTSGDLFKIGNSGTVTFNGGTVTASSPVLNVNQTWNNAAVTFTAANINVTDTASNAASLLMDLQVGGTSQFSLNKSGLLTAKSATIGSNFSVSTLGRIGTIVCDGVLQINDIYGNGIARWSIGTAGNLVFSSGAELGWYSTSVAAGGNFDLKLTRDAAQTLAQRNSTNAQTFRLYRTASGSPGSDYERLALSSTTYSSAVYQTIAAESAGTGAANINMVVSPKGTGAFMLKLADGSNGGNARGQYAVDLQIASGAAAQVASGNYSVIIGGDGNQASGQWSVVGGRACSATADYAIVIGGRTSSVTNQYGAVLGGYTNSAGFIATVAGGRENTASANYSAITGGWNGLADRPFQRAFGADKFAVQGDAQECRFILKIKTTNATATTLLLPDGTTRLTIPSGKVFAFVAKISGIKSDGSAVAFYTRKGCIKNVGGTTSLVGTIDVIGVDIEDNASTDVAITADDTNDALQINVTGIDSETWRWVAVVEGVEIGYGT